MYAAYFDRKTENNDAILLVEALQKNYVVSLSSLPSTSEPGDWFLVTIVNDEIKSITKDIHKTNQMKKEIADRMARLQSKQRSRFKR